MIALPRSASMAAWLGARLAGTVSPDEYADAVRGEDPQHLVVGLTPEPLSLELGAAALAGLGATSTSLALPVPGDPAGLAGPPAFNDAAYESGEAVLVHGSGLGLVPEIDARTVLWRALPATPPPPADPDEAGRRLRTDLVEATNRLVELDVARWQPEITDLLINRHETDLELPPGFRPRLRETVSRALLCSAVVGLALSGDGGAVSAYDMERRREALRDLERSARRALVAAFSVGG